MVNTFMSITVPVALGTTVLRYIVNRQFAGARLGRREAATDRIAKLVEEAWLLVASTCLLAFSTVVVARYNDHCAFFDRSGCFEGWPSNVTSPETAWSMAAFLGWYIHGLLKSLIPGVGLRSGVDMLGHHVLTLALFACTQIFSVTRIGFLLLALLNFSNPFMHIAKVLHHMRAPKAATASSFLLFAAAFAVSRCMFFPSLIVTAVVETRAHFLDGDTRVVLPFVVCMLGLGTLQILQFYWFGRIVLVVKNGGMERRSEATTKAAEGPFRVDASAAEREGSLLRESDESSATSAPAEEGTDDVDDVDIAATYASTSKAPFVRQRPFFDSANGDAQLRHA